MNLDFVAIDVETANPNMSSICQIGLVHFKNNEIISEWKTYINPEDYFCGVNISIHGIDEDTVKDAPKFLEISSTLNEYLTGRISVCHTHFDRIALQKLHEKHSLQGPTCTWLDSARVARRAWEEFAYGGYGLKSVCSKLGYSFAHHDALEDAKAAAFIIREAVEKTGVDLAGWLKRVNQPIGSMDNNGKIAREGNPEGDLFGEVIVFTGALSMPRSMAAEQAAKIGCTVSDGVNKKTTILVVGDQDVTRLGGKDKSSKHIKAEQLISKGQSIRIIRESDFKALVTI